MFGFNPLTFDLDVQTAVKTATDPALNHDEIETGVSQSRCLMVTSEFYKVSMF